MCYYYLTAFLVFASAAVATPVLSINVCPIVSDVVAGLHACTTADAFCSSFIGIKTSALTATAIATPSAVVLPDSITNTASPVTVTSTVSTDTTLVSNIPVTITPSPVTVTSTSVETDPLTCFSTATTLGAAGNNAKRNFPIPSSSSTKVTSTPKTSSTSSPKATASYTVPAQLSSFASSAISTACSCLSLTTPSITNTVTTTLQPISKTSTYLATVTPTSTVTVTVTNTVTSFASSTQTLDPYTSTVIATSTTSTVQPTGLTYYYYYPDTEAFDYSNVQSCVDATSNNPQWHAAGTISNINTIRNGGDANNRAYNFNLPSTGESVPGQGFAMIFQGYLYAAAGAGTYTISSRDIDDTALAWVGPKAYGNAWNYANSDYVAEFPVCASCDYQVRFTLAQGEAVPITLYYSNAQGPGSASYVVVGPDGNQYTDTTPFFFGECAGSGLFTA